MCEERGEIHKGVLDWIRDFNAVATIQERTRCSLVTEGNG